MSTPQDSTAPAPILPSDPAYVADKTNAVRYSERSSDWIAALSPSGADVYDTEWVELTSASGDSAGLAVRRVGSTVMLRGEVWGVTAGATLFTLASQFRPTVRKAYLAVRAGGGTGAIGGDARVFIQTSGEVRMHNFNTMPAASPGIDISQTWFV